VCVYGAELTSSDAMPCYAGVIRSGWLDVYGGCTPIRSDPIYGYIMSYASPLELLYQVSLHEFLKHCTTCQHAFRSS
jgi:hypothetical protein